MWVWVSIPPVWQNDVIHPYIYLIIKDLKHHTIHIIKLYLTVVQPKFEETWNTITHLFTDKVRFPESTWHDKATLGFYHLCSTWDVKVLAHLPVVWQNMKNFNCYILLFLKNIIPIRDTNIIFPGFFYFHQATLYNVLQCSLHVFLYVLIAQYSRH